MSHVGAPSLRRRSACPITCSEVRRRSPVAGDGGGDDGNGNDGGGGRGDGGDGGCDGGVGVPSNLDLDLARWTGCSWADAAGRTPARRSKDKAQLIARKVDRAARPSVGVEERQCNTPDAGCDETARRPCPREARPSEVESARLSSFGYSKKMGWPEVE